MSNVFGNKIRELREDKQIPQRQLAAALEIDTATYCKIEKGDRRAKREQLRILANLLQVDTNELNLYWSADQVYKIIAEEEEATQILNFVADIIVKYKRKTAKA
ncbi:MAG: helix-turn-helix domain-containing protein [Bacteroidales bacterium]|nr:helix-turn-helix domain-containing protein [Bacteroidales bacterium]